GHGQLGRQRLRRNRLSEQSTLLVDIAVDGEGCVSEDCVDHRLLLGAHGGSPFGWLVGSTSGSLAHVNPLLFPVGRPASSASLAAKQVKRPHRITVIRTTGDRRGRRSMIDSRDLMLRGRQ